MVAGHSQVIDLFRSAVLITTRWRVHEELIRHISCTKKDSTILDISSSSTRSGDMQALYNDHIFPSGKETRLISTILVCQLDQFGFAKARLIDKSQDYLGTVPWMKGWP